jgi:cbb3-type cytochrome oxidase subunit 3
LENIMQTFMTFLSEYGWFVGLPLVLLAVIAWVYRPGARRRYQGDSEIPFDDNTAASPKQPVSGKGT